jgi:hypothetical protein
MKQNENIERLLFVSKPRNHGDEARVREVIEREFPKEAFQRAGLVGFTVYSGGGNVIFEFGFEGNFDDIFRKLCEDGTVQSFFERLGQLVDPVPRIKPGETAQVPLAADIFAWRAESGKVIARQPSLPRPSQAAGTSGGVGAGAGIGATGPGDNIGGTGEKRPPGRERQPRGEELRPTEASALGHEPRQPEQPQRPPTEAERRPPAPPKKPERRGPEPGSGIL